jgi:hypothetical protein
VELQNEIVGREVALDLKLISRAGYRFRAGILERGAESHVALSLTWPEISETFAVKKDYLFFVTTCPQVLRRGVIPV